MSAIGTIVRVDAGGQTLTRHVKTGTGEGNQNEPTLHFGLGSVNTPVSVEITWPDGTVRALQADPNKTMRITYNLDDVEPPVEPPVELPDMTTIEIGEVGNIVGLTHNVKNIFLNRSYENPVVFAQSASSNGDDLVVVRVTNVQSDQFQIFLAESSDKNGLHNTGETVTYLVLEAGDYRLTDGTQVNVGTVTTSATLGAHMENTWESVSFTNPFDRTPVVLSQIQTQSATGANYLQTRHVLTSSSTVVLALEQEEAVTKPHPGETIGYLAIDSGSGTWNNMAYEAKVRNGLVTANFTQVTYVKPFGEIPNLLTSLTSYVGRDNAHLRYTNPAATGVLLKIEEETTYDSELEHSIEQISYLAIAGQGMLTALEPQIAIGEVDTVTNLTHVPREIQLKKTYTNPVVFAQSPGTVGMDPVVVRVTNVQPNRFTMYLAEPSNLNGLHNAGETASYVVMEAGSHYLFDGTRLEVGTVETKATVGKIVSNQWEEVGFSNGFETTPVILTQIQTTNPGGQNYLQTRHLSVDNSGFTVALEQAEIQSAQHGVTETIGYLAMEDGTGQWGDLTYEVAKTPIVITDQ